MTRSLKERHQQRRLNELERTVRSADRQLVIESRVSDLLVEAMDDDDLEKVSAIVDKLSALKTPQLPKLTAAIEKAEAELNKYTAGGPLTKAWSKMKGLVGIDNPVVKVSVFADALERGFSQIPQILRNNGVDLKGVDLSKNLVQVLGQRRLPSAPQKKGEEKPIGSKSDKEFGNKHFGGDTRVDREDSINVPKQQQPTTPKPKAQSKSPSARIGHKKDHEFGDEFRTQAEANRPAAPRITEADSKADVEQRIKNIVGQLQKALSPSGIFGAFKKVPYIDSNELAQELINAPLKVFSGVARKVNSGTKAADIADDIKQQASAGGDAETRGTKQEEPPKQPSQTSTTSHAKGPTTTTGTTPAGERPATQGTGAEKNAQEKIQGLFSSLKGKQDAWGVLTRKLLDAGLDPSKL